MDWLHDATTLGHPTKGRPREEGPGPDQREVREVVAAAFEREEKLMNQAGYLNLLTNAVVTWTGGTINGDGTLITQGTLTLGSASAFDAETLGAATLDNAGPATLAVENGNTAYGLYMCSGALFDSQPGASFSFQTDAEIYSNGVSAPTFKNEETLVKPAGTGTSPTNAVFNQTGTGSLQVQSGTLQFNGGGTLLCAGISAFQGREQTLRSARADPGAEVRFEVDENT